MLHAKIHATHECAIAWQSNPRAKKYTALFLNFILVIAANGSHNIIIIRLCVLCYGYSVHKYLCTLILFLCYFFRSACFFFIATIKYNVYISVD